VLRSRLAFALAASALFLACWIFIAAPTRGLLRLSVGAPEVSVWLVAASLIAAGLALAGLRARVTARVGLTLALLTLGLALTPLLRLPATARRLAVAERAALGADPLDDVSDAARSRMRHGVLDLRELLGGVALGDARVTRGIIVSTVGGVRLTADVYRPAREGTFPIVVQVYGGAWQRGTPGDFSNFGRWLAARGYVVFSIDYRHAPQARWPAQLADVRTNLAWIRAHASEYGGDPTRVALLGRSAGAHLAMLGAYTDGPLPIRAVISFYGPVDLVDAYEHPPHPDPLKIRDVEDTLFGRTLDEMREVYRLASPITYATRPLPATLLIYGGRDHIVEPRYGVRLRDRLAATGTTVLLLDIPWADHAFDEVFNGPSSQLALYHVERFLAWAMNASSRAPGDRANDPPRPSKSSLAPDQVKLQSRELPRAPM
jgi:acetyl esterase/lipase